MFKFKAGDLVYCEASNTFGTVWGYMAAPGQDRLRVIWQRDDAPRGKVLTGRLLSHVYEENLRLVRPCVVCVAYELAE